MPYTVNRPDGNSATEFETYVRLLRQNGIDIGNLPRVPEPNSRRKWLYVWADRDAAETFRNELADQTGSQLWQVIETTAPPSDGPFGPLIIRLARRHGQFVFDLDLLSRHMIRTAYPNAQGVSSLTVPASTLNELRKERKDYFPSVLRTILPALTGLTLDELAEVGYAVLDADTEQWESYKAPAGLSVT